MVDDDKDRADPVSDDFRLGLLHILLDLPQYGHGQDSLTGDNVLN